MSAALILDLLDDTFAVARLAPAAAVPAWALGGALQSITRTPGELSVLCAADQVPPEVRAERGFRCLRVRGPLAFDQTGILAGLTAPLAAAEVPVFAVSTFDTDYLLVPGAALEPALAALRRAGYEVHS